MRKPSYTFAFRRDTEALEAMHPFLHKSKLGMFNQTLDLAREIFDQSQAVRYLDILKAMSQVPVPSNNFSDIAKKLTPWRKGPFFFQGKQIIDAEWDSTLKWDRLQLKKTDIHNKVVLDVGSNSGYYLFELMKMNPKLAIGVDPTLLYYFQFYALRSLLLDSVGAKSCHMFCTGFESMDAVYDVFDAIFCMGILYHHRYPVHMLNTLMQCGKKRHDLYLETIFYDTKDDVCLTPKASTYAGMPNVYFLPSLSVIQEWLKQSGYGNFEVLDVSTTTDNEQRHIPEWAGEFSGIQAGLDPNNNDLTIEGYPRPKRVLIKASVG